MDKYTTTRAEERTRVSVEKALARFIRKHGGSRKAAIARAAKRNASRDKMVMLGSPDNANGAERLDLAS